jgi:hypothetical protein
MDLSNYVDVPSRFALALDKWPDLRVVESPPEVVTVGDQTFISVTMTVYRTPDDLIPARGCAWEPIPGKSSFTRGSEMMNASTSALGRAIGLMMPFGKMASMEEVRNRQPDTRSQKPAERTESSGDSPSDAQLRMIRALGHSDAMPTTKAAASTLITALKNKATSSDEGAF